MSLVLSFPGGKVLDVAIAATAGNVVTDKSPGALKRWLFLYAQITYVADGNASNRLIKPEITDGTKVIWGAPTSAAITAGQTRIIRMAQNVNGPGIANPSNVVADMGLGALIIEGDDEFRIRFTDGLAGDSYSGNIRVLELGITP